MSDRKFSKDRGYKLSRLIVNVIAVLGLLWLTFLLLNYNQTQSIFLKTWKDCSVTMGKDTEGICANSYLSLTSDYYKNIKYAAIMGIVIPVIFYGGIYLYKYLFPKSDKDKK